MRRGCLPLGGHDRPTHAPGAAGFVVVVISVAVVTHSVVLASLLCRCRLKVVLLLLSVLRSESVLASVLSVPGVPAVTAVVTVVKT